MADVMMGGILEDEPAAAPERRRLYCPVVGCPEGNCERAQGWMDPVRHLDGHASGRFLGDVLVAWLAEHGLHGVQPHSGHPIRGDVPEVPP